ncbi:MAG: hypothetical protein V3T11_09950 [Roseateles sp.]
MAQFALRTPDDVRRLFSALGDELTHETGALSVTDIDNMALNGVGLDALDEVDATGLGITVLVAMAAGWSAIKAYERNQHQMQWGLAWGVLGGLFPLPAVVYSAVKG